MKFTSFSFVAYAITDVAKSRAFYEGVLGLKAGSIWEGEGMAFIEYAVGQDTLVIGKGAPQFTPGKTGATATLETDDFDGAVSELRASGVKLLMEPHETPVCHMALIEDPDGNQIMIHRRKASAK